MAAPLLAVQVQVGATRTLVLFLGFGAAVRRDADQRARTGQPNALFPLDPAGMNSSTNALKEIKNGRLAMVAFVGFAVQALVTREGPIEGLFAHLANPFGHNIITNIANLPNVIGK